MSKLHLGLLVLYALGMAVGQALFKTVAVKARAAAGGLSWRALLGVGEFYLALALYGALTLAWIWLLTKVPLSRAYPFVALSFAFTPMLAYVFFDETVNAWYVGSLGLIVAGLLLLVWKAS